MLAASFSTMLGVSAAGVAPPPAGVVDQRSLADLRSRGHVVAAGTDEELLVSPVLKPCVLRDGETTDEQRRAILTREEVDAVRRSFGDDPHVFIRIAVATYCS